MENNLNKKNFFSIAIPTYEMNGFGSEFLNHSFNILYNQTFTDFEIVVSDHSKNDTIKDLCHYWSEKLNIKYIRNTENIGSSSSNINNAIKNSNGEWIKILFQDDFLYSIDSLKDIHDEIQNNKDSRWLVTASEHTNDGRSYYRPFFPRWVDDIQYGNNTISSPSVLTIKNNDLIFFDEILIWLMDVDYYKQLYDKWGLPIFLQKINVVNRTWSSQLSNTIPEERKKSEYFLMVEKYKIKMIDLKNVTIICVDCVSADLALKAMEFSMSGINFGSSKIITSQNISHDIIEIVNIDKLNYEEYSRFIVYELWKYVDTDYALLIQSDGFVINPTLWQDDFLNYDYIGAPWALPSDDFSYRDAFGNIVRVGNGGFSLRSKKILSLSTKLNLEWKSYFGYYNEDGFFTCHNRHLFEAEGCVFAPLDVAKYFSHEAQIPEVQGIYPFGFHGKCTQFESNGKYLRKYS